MSQSVPGPGPVPPESHGVMTHREALEVIALVCVVLIREVPLGTAILRDDEVAPADGEREVEMVGSHAAR